MSAPTLPRAAPALLLTACTAAGAHELPAGPLSEPFRWNFQPWPLVLFALAL